MKVINTYWFQKKGTYGNFGDELGPYLIKKLSGNDIYRVPINRSSIKLILAYFKGVFLGYYSIKMLPSIVKTLFLNGRYIISVGSIIGWGSGPRIVWGSGILFYNEAIDNGEFLAVRGKYTQDRLRNLGYIAPDVFGDPALLLPLVYKPKVTKSARLGIIPHHTQFEHFAPYQKKHSVKVINLLGEIEAIIDEIMSCEYIISSSLHGVIVSHAYNIPALWYEFPDIKWHGENVKFLDYFSSVDIAEYKPFLLKNIDDFNADEEVDNILLNTDIAHVNVDLSAVQKGLLNVAPFDLLEMYNQYVNS